MRYFVIVCAIGMLACFGGQKRYYRVYRIKATDEGAACARQCTVVQNTCLSANARYDNVGSYCDEEHEKCRGTCPGAERVADREAIYRGF
jgi:hypothetical protein